MLRPQILKAKNAFLLFALLLTPFVFAKTTVIKVGTVAPANTPWADTLEDLKKRIEKQSNGSFQMKTYLGGQLGGEIEILRAIRSGRVQAGGFSSGALANVVPEMDIIEIPFLFESSEEADYVLDHVLLKPYQELFKKKGLILTSWAENGWRDMGSRTKLIQKPSDLKGMKVRSQESKTHLEFWKALGANPLAIAIPEVLPALQTGMVDGFDNTALFSLSAEWHTAIKYYTVTHHIYQPGAVVYDKKFWDKLSDADQKILLGNGNEDAPKWRKAVRDLQDQLIGVLKESGVQVKSLSASEKKEFQKLTESLPKVVIAAIGGESQKFYDLILQGKKEFASKKKK